MFNVFSSQVDIPLDPFLFEMISSSGAEVDLLQKRQIHYFFKVLFALLPGILILWFIRESMMLLHITTNRLLYKKYKQLFDMAYAENFVLVTFHHLIPVSSIFSEYFGSTSHLLTPTPCLLSQLEKLVRRNRCIKK